MKLYRFIIYTLIFLLNSCEQSSRNISRSKSEARKYFYAQQMRKKDYKFYSIEDCEQKSEYVHHSDTVYFEWVMNSKKGKVIQFKLQQNCSSEFMGDYSTRNDTLFIELEDISENISLCNCLFSYRMELNTGHAEFNAIEFAFKEI